MGNLTERQKLILALVIRTHIETAHPVGSQRLVDQYHLEISSATVRSEMAALTEAGYLRQPHTSAGRVPSEAGYRYFVRQLMGHTDLPITTKRTINHQFFQARHDTDQWMRLAVSVLAHQSQAASWATAPQADKARFKHLELIATRGRQVLMVLVLGGGVVRQQMLVLAEPVPQERLSAVASQLNLHYMELDAQGILDQAHDLDDLTMDITQLVHDEMGRSNTYLSGEVYRDGLTNVLTVPEFAESEAARGALRVLEERALMEDLMSSTAIDADIGGVQVLIGGEGNWEELRECSVVLARYGAPGLASGMLGVLGPIRMRYGKTISTVRFVAGILSNLVEDTLSE
jgi:heat-inducible transcriptional repressor